MTFLDVVLASLECPGMVREFNRLSGCKLGVDNRKPIEMMVDKACGNDPLDDPKQMEYMDKFVAFVWDCIWTRLEHSDL